MDAGKVVNARHDADFQTVAGQAGSRRIRPASHHPLIRDEVLHDHGFADGVRTGVTSGIGP
jgi:hypothetical protein